jgi:hypothetical protein
VNTHALQHSEGVHVCNGGWKHEKSRPRPETLTWQPSRVFRRDSDQDGNTKRGLNRKEVRPLLSLGYKRTIS